MRCRSIPSVKPMPIRGQAELAEQAQATASGRHVTGVPVSVIPAAWLQVIYIFLSLDLFIILNFWVDNGSTQALRPSLLDPVPLQGKDMLQLLPLPTFTCGCSTLGGVRTTAKPKAALKALLCDWSVSREGLSFRGMHTVLQPRHPYVLGRPRFGQGRGSSLGSCWLAWLSAELLPCATPGWVGQWLASQ